MPTDTRNLLRRFDVTLYLTRYIPLCYSLRRQICPIRESSNPQDYVVAQKTAGLKSGLLYEYVLVDLLQQPKLLFCFHYVKDGVRWTLGVVIIYKAVYLDIIRGLRLKLKIEDSILKAFISSISGGKTWMKSPDHGSLWTQNH